MRGLIPRPRPSNCYSWQPHRSAGRARLRAGFLCFCVIGRATDPGDACAGRIGYMRAHPYMVLRLCLCAYLRGAECECAASAWAGRAVVSEGDPFSTMCGMFSAHAPPLRLLGVTQRSSFSDGRRLVAGPVWVWVCGPVASARVPWSSPVHSPRQQLLEADAGASVHSFR